MKDDTTEYWDKHWKERLPSPDGIEFNEGKMKYLLRLLWQRPYLINMKTLDIGCGTCFHIHHLSELAPGWKTDYLGLDLSDVAITRAMDFGINAMVGDVHTFFDGWYDKHDFELFLFLDSLEHINGHVKLAEKLKMIAAPRYNIFGNIPLYKSDHGADVERDMNIAVLSRFMNKLEIPKFHYEVYGIHGWPYLWWEGEHALTD